MRVTIRLDSNLRKEVEEMAEREGVSVSEIIRRAIVWRCTE